MKRVKIRQPIWKNNSVGVADYHFTDEGSQVEVEITYVIKKTGERWDSNIYLLSYVEARRCPTMIVGRGTLVYCVPIADLRKK